MTRNQLPEGVGKKIVEALKRQAEADITPVPEANSSLNDLSIDNTKVLPEINMAPLEEEINLNENLIIEEELPDILPQGVYQEKIETSVPETNTPTLKADEQTMINFSNAQAQINEKLQQVIQPQIMSTITIPENVALLRNLIASLPVGVAKQTGAQIIRQTLEAMGLPISRILKEAQVFQEELNGSSKECMLRIQEYKTNILQLEQSVQEYQKNITQINDLVSLFLMTDRK